MPLLILLLDLSVKKVVSLPFLSNKLSFESELKLVLFAIFPIISDLLNEIVELNRDDTSFMPSRLVGGSCGILSSTCKPEPSLIKASEPCESDEDILDNFWFLKEKEGEDDPGDAEDEPEADDIGFWKNFGITCEIGDEVGDFRFLTFGMLSLENLLLFGD